VIVLVAEPGVILLREVAATQSKIQMDLGFCGFAIAVAQLADEGCFITALTPRLGKVRAD
jgi:hypothetical protein